MRRVFYSFHHKADSWRTAKIRNIGGVHGNFPASDNEWEGLTRGGDAAIKQWIDGQMIYRSCTVVLVGSNTAKRKWITYEIVKSWNKGMGVVGIYVHGLEDMYGETSLKGMNPFSSITHTGSNQPLSSIVKCYEPEGRTSSGRYDWVAQNLANVIEEAIMIRHQW